MRFIATQTGVRQFLDIGICLSADPSVHEIAQEARRSARVVYVDTDPRVLSRAQSLLTRNSRVAVIDGDLRRPETILNNPELLDLMTLTEPMAVLLGAVLHYVEPDAAAGQVGAADDPGRGAGQLCRAFPFHRRRSLA